MLRCCQLFMPRDPIVEEVRRNREAIAREHGNNVDAIVAAFQTEEAISGVTTVSFPPKRIGKSSAKLAKPRKMKRASKRMGPRRSGSRKRAVHS